MIPAVQWTMTMYNGRELEVAAYTIKIPLFCLSDPLLGFMQVESEFVLRVTTAQLMKFHHVLAKPSQEIATEVRDLLMNPPAKNLLLFSKRLSLRGPLSQSNDDYSSCLALRILEIRSLLICFTKCSSYSVLRLKETVTQLQATLTHHHMWQRPFVNSDLSHCTHIFVQQDTERQTLQQPCHSPHKAVKHGAKTFTVDVNSSQEVISMDHLKPTHFEHLSTIDVTATDDSLLPPSPSIQTPPPTGRETRSGRHFIQDLIIPGRL